MKSARWFVLMLTDPARMTLKQDIAVAVVMLVGGCVPAGVLEWLTGSTTWAAVMGGLMFWPAAFVGGCVALLAVDRRDS